MIVGAQRTDTAAPGAIQKPDTVPPLYSLASLSDLDETCGETSDSDSEHRCEVEDNTQESSVLILDDVKATVSIMGKSKVKALKPRNRLQLSPAARRVQIPQDLCAGRRLPSSLKPTSGILGTKKASTKRRVRGLWNNGPANGFADLNDDLIGSIFGHFSSAGLVKVAMVCRRFQYIAGLDAHWKHVDATEYVERAFEHFGKLASDTAAEQTSSALTAHLASHAPETLRIANIKHRLTAHSFLPSLKGLQELHLSAFADLTDTHVHVMLLSYAVGHAHGQAKAKSSNSLRKLSLEQCPLLTNATLRSISLTCSVLEELSVRGCRKMTSIEALKDCWKATKRAPKLPSVSSMNSLASFFAPPAPRPAATPAALGLSSLFAPPPLVSAHSPAAGLSSLFAPPSAPSLPCAAPAALSSLFAPPPSSRPAPPPLKPFDTSTTTPLASLFTPPTGMSPPRAPPRTFSLTRGPASTTGGQLVAVNLSHTGVTPRQLVRAWEAIGGEIQLESLTMIGTGEAWRNGDLQALTQCLDLVSLKAIDLGCASLAGTSSLVSLATLEAANKLESLGLAGHRSLPASGLVGVLASAKESLVELNLEGCKRLFSNDTEALLLAGALAQCKSLKTLSLARCFNNETQSSTRSLGEEEARGKVLVDAMAEATFKDSFQVLDMSGCWWFTNEDEIRLCRSCRRMTIMHVAGTRAAAHRKTTSLD